LACSLQAQVTAITLDTKTSLQPTLSKQRK
jgi:hypothetical protein